MPLYRAELLAKKPLRYAALIHDVSQVLYLPFDYDDGSYARDRSGYNNSGTIYGATLTAGKIGMGRKFDGVDDEVEIPHSESLNVISEITVALYVYDTTGPTNMGIISKGNRGETWFIDAENSEAPVEGMEWFVKTTAGAFVLHAPLGYMNKWIHLVAVAKTGYMAIWIDGIEVAMRSDITGSILTTTNPLVLGAHFDGLFFRGILDEVRIYNRALSADEIRMLMYRRLV